MQRNQESSKRELERAKREFEKSVKLKECEEDNLNYKIQNLEKSLETKKNKIKSLKTVKLTYIKLKFYYELIFFNLKIYL